MRIDPNDRLELGGRGTGTTSMRIDLVVCRVLGDQGMKPTSKRIDPMYLYGRDDQDRD
jgi:hypothetical protein